MQLFDDSADLHFLRLEVTNLVDLFIFGMSLRHMLFRALRCTAVPYASLLMSGELLCLSGSSICARKAQCKGFLVTFP